MYHIKHKTEYFNGRATMMICYEIADDNRLVIESSASEGTAKYYESLNKEERKRKEADKMKMKTNNNANIRDIDKLRRLIRRSPMLSFSLPFGAKSFTVNH